LTRVPLVGHGIGGRLDLPVPTTFFIAGGAVVLIVTFVALAVLWPRPRLQNGPRPAPPGRRVGLGPLRWLGVAGLVIVILAGIAALITETDQVGSRNIGPVLLWVYFWLVVPFLSAFLGNLYTGINPWRSLSGWLGVGERERSEFVSRAGLWPAAAILVAFAWLELVYPDSGAPASIGIAALAYTVFLLTMIGGLGRETALTSFDPFNSYNRLISSIAPFGRDSEGRLVRRGWLRALPMIPEWKGLAAFLVTMIGTVSFDGLSGTTWWATAMGDFGASIPGMTLLLIAMCGLIGCGYYLACLAAARMGGRDQTAGTVASRFAHTLVPIALAYAFAHYFTLVMFEGQSVVSAASDPFGLGWDLFGTRTYKINFFLGALPVWYIQVATIVTGHVAGVILAHDRALADFKGVGAVRSQYAMLALMVLLTGLGLFILAG
jgi:hypothetical protein